MRWALDFGPLLKSWSEDSTYARVIHDLHAIRLGSIDRIVTMTTSVTQGEQHDAGGVVDHLSEARHRALRVLAAESHLGAVDDWRRALISARDAVIVIWLTWVALHAFGDPEFTDKMLVAMSIAMALLVSMSTARSTHTQLQYYACELERERTEIRDNFEAECDEIRVLYAAKGFSEPLLGQIVDTLSADEDRLLKVMMEEELGLSMYHINHPLIVGLWNFGASLAAGLALALPVGFLSADAAILWMPIGGSALLLVVSVIAAWATARNALEFLTVSLLMAIVTGGVVYFLAGWLVGLT